MALARYESVAVNTAGDVIPNATVEVRRDQPGRPVVPLWADREGTVALGNPITTDSEGKFGFHVTGGSFYIRVFTGPSQQPLQQYVRRYQAIGTAAERDVEDLATALEAGTATFPTLADLAMFIPTDEGVGGKVTTGPDAGFYHYDDVAGAWVFDRPLYDTLARMVVTGGSANAIEADLETGVADSAVVMLWLESPANNTGPLTINGKTVLTIDGAELLAGQWLAGRTYWFTDQGDHYKLRTESDVSGLVAQAEVAATAALGAAGVAAGAAGAAATSANEAAGFAAGLNIAPILPGDAGKLLRVNAEEDGSDWVDPPNPITDGDKGDVTVSESGESWALSDSAKGKLVGIAADRVALAAMPGSIYKSVDLMEAGRKGRFQWDGSNVSAMVTLDTRQGIYVPSISDPTGVSGAWVRIFDGKPDPYWFGALGGTNNDSAAVQACLGVTGQCCFRYRANGYTLGGIILGDHDVVEADRKTTLFFTGGAGGYMFAIRSFGIGEYSHIRNVLLDGAAADVNSTAIRFDTGSAVVFGFRGSCIDFKNWGEAIGDVAHATNYVVDVMFHDCLCFFTRGRQVYSRRSRGFFAFRDFKIDHTYNTAQVTWEGARFADMIGLELEKFDVVGPTQPASTYQAAAIGLVIAGVAGSSASVWLRRVLVDNTRGPGISINSVHNLFAVDLCVFQNLGTALELGTVTKSQLTNTKIVGGIGLTGAAASAAGVSMASCVGVTFSNLEVESNTGNGVVQVSCTDCNIIGGYSNSNSLYGYAEVTAATRNLRSGVRALGNATGSLVQIGAQSATTNWWPNGGNYLPSNVGAITV